MGFESPQKNLADENLRAKEQFKKLPEKTKNILSKYVNPETIATDSLRPEDASSVEGDRQVVPSVSERRAKSKKDFPTWIEKSLPPEREIE